MQGDTVGRVSVCGRAHSARSSSSQSLLSWVPTLFLISAERAWAQRKFPWPSTCTILRFMSVLGSGLEKKVPQQIAKEGWYWTPGWPEWDLGMKFSDSLKMKSFSQLAHSRIRPTLSFGQHICFQMVPPGNRMALGCGIKHWSETSEKDPLDKKIYKKW